MTAAPHAPSAAPTTADADDLPLAQLETEIATLSGHLAAATCRLLLMLASFDTRQGWGGGGMRSCAHWLSWRCGMGLSTAHEHLRVAHTLTSLPHTRSAFAAGRLSYTKVRSLTRVATPATESELVTIALNAPAAHLDRLVAGLRRAATQADDDDVAARAEHRHRWDLDGSLVVTVRLTAQDGATYLAALRATRDALDDRCAVESPGSSPSTPDDGSSDATGSRPATTQAEAFVAMAEGALEHLPTRGPFGHRPEVVVHVDLDVLSAPDVDRTTEQSLGTRRCHVHDGPGIMPAVARALACDAGVVLAVHDPTRVGALMDVGRRRRRPTAPILRALWIRDRGCVHPGCHRRRLLHAHHVRHWARGGSTSLANMVLLCRYHHHALHRGEFDVRIDASGTPRLNSPAGPLPDAPEALPGSCSLGDTHGADITLSTPSSGAWLGEPLRLGYAVTALHDAWSRSTRPWTAAPPASIPEAESPAGDDGENRSPVSGAGRPPR